MIWNKELREEHFVTVAKGIFNWGPYFFLCGLIIAGMVQIGWLEMPAFAEDVRKLEMQLETVQKDVGSIKKQINEATTRQLVIENEVKNTNKTLDGISKQLNLLLRSKHDHGPPN